MRHFALMLAVAVVGGLGLSALVGRLADRRLSGAALPTAAPQPASLPAKSPADPLDYELRSLNAAMNDYDAWRARQPESARVVAEVPASRPALLDEDAVPEEFSDLVDAMTAAAAERAYNAAYSQLVESDLADLAAEQEPLLPDAQAASQLQGRTTGQQRRAERLRQLRQEQSLRNRGE